MFSEIKSVVSTKHYLYIYIFELFDKGHTIFHPWHKRGLHYYLIAGATIPTLFITLLFGGIFVYVGTFSQLVYLYQVFPDKSETFKALNCISATSVPLSKYFFMWFSRLVRFYI